MKKSYYIIIVAVVLAGGFIFWKFGFNKPVSQPEVKINFPADLGEVQTYEPPAGENFTFSYPNKLKVTEQDIEGVDGAKRLLVESNEPGKGFELVILPFDETAPLTEARLRLDVPDMVMENVKNISLSGIPALAFDSTDDNIGETHEVWFNHAGFLYQARTYPDFGSVMEEILKTFKFK